MNLPGFVYHITRTQQAVMTVRHTRHNVQTHPICHNKASWRLFRINGDNSLSPTVLLTKIINFELGAGIGLALTSQISRSPPPGPV